MKFGWSCKKATLHPGDVSSAQGSKSRRPRSGSHSLDVMVKVQQAHRVADIRNKNASPKVDQYARYRETSRVADLKKTGRLPPAKHDIKLYIGEIRPHHTLDDLWNLFSQCGDIYSMELRCSQGNVSVLPPVEGEHWEPSPNDIRHAVVKFFETSSIRPALEKNGVVLKGCKLLVTHCPSNLPELRNIVDEHLGRRVVPKQLKMEPTLVVTPPGSPKPGVLTHMTIA
ncbi:hypothetical protein K435DRAFT_833037 [Dendrothele bispora CBS 962.96]|uniref:RRM domain-containing protein n=1 Tax=Dendrothele bispora (strain CBS 962.96) TaxID=1314807 RepID=A0A4S8MZM7_DENBC|nr:hypothetical protein K435DRAFT_833037 [Dendrothele bispora CBS 962.96]